MLYLYFNSIIEENTNKRANCIEVQHHQNQVSVENE